MRRSATGAILAVSLALILAPVLAVAAGIAAGAWVPTGGATAPTPSPAPIEVGYDEFLEAVRGGEVESVIQQGARLDVSGIDGEYVVAVPSSGTEVMTDMARAADAGGVDMPGYASTSGPDGEPEAPVARTWAELLEGVETGRVFDIFHQGRRVTASTERGAWEVAVPADVLDVLAAIEAAAAAGGIPPPYYSKAPE